MSTRLVYKCDGCGCEITNPDIHGNIWKVELRLNEEADPAFHACNYTCFFVVLDKLKDKARQALSKVRIV